MATKIFPRIQGGIFLVCRFALIIMGHQNSLLEGFPPSGLAPAGVRSLPGARDTLRSRSGPPGRGFASVVVGVGIAFWGIPNVVGWTSARYCQAFSSVFARVSSPHASHILRQPCVTVTLSWLQCARAVWYMRR